MIKSVIHILIVFSTCTTLFAQSNQVHYSGSLGLGFIEEFSFKKEVSDLLNPTLFDCGCYNSKPVPAQPQSFRYCTKANYLSFRLSRNRGKNIENLKLDYYQNDQRLGIQGSSMTVRYVQLGYFYGRTAKSWVKNKIEFTPTIGIMGRYGYDDFFVDYGRETFFTPTLRRRLADIALSIGPQFAFHFYRRFSLSTKFSYDKWVFNYDNYFSNTSYFGRKATNQISLQFSLSYRFCTKELDK